MIEESEEYKEEPSNADASQLESQEDIPKV